MQQSERRKQDRRAPATPTSPKEQPAIKKPKKRSASNTGGATVGGGS